MKPEFTLTFAFHPLDFKFRLFYSRGHFKFLGLSLLCFTVQAGFLNNVPIDLGDVLYGQGETF